MRSLIAAGRKGGLMAVYRPRLLLSTAAASLAMQIAGFYFAVEVRAKVRSKSHPSFHLPFKWL